jgi:hypothetical protein
VDAPRSSPAGQPGESDPRDESATPRKSAFRFAHPAPPETQVVNNGFDAMWESRNKGKLFKDMTIPEPEE